MMDIITPYSSLVEVNMPKSIFSLIVVLLLSIGVGCGNSGNKKTEPSAPQTILSGTVSTGNVLGGATVFVMDTNGKTVQGATTETGTFEIDVYGLTAPLILRASSGSDVLLSFVETINEKGTNVNVTPYTTQILSLAVTNDLSKKAAQDLTALTSSQISAAKSIAENYLLVLKKVCASDEGLTDVLADFNLFSSSFSTGGTGFDMVLDLVKMTVLDYSDQTLQVTVGASNLNVDFNSISTASFGAVQGALLQAANQQKSQYEKIVLFIAINSNDSSIELYSMWSDGTNLNKFTGTTSTYQSKGAFSISPDRSSFLISENYYDANGFLMWVNVVEYSVVNKTKTTVFEKCNYASYSPSGKQIAAKVIDPDDTSKEALCVFDRADTTKYSKYTLGDLDPSSWIWMPDSSGLYVSLYNGNDDGSSSDIYSVRKSGIVKMTSVATGEYVDYPSISSDGKMIAYVFSSGSEESSPKGTTPTSTHHDYLYLGTTDGSSIKDVRRLADIDALSPVITPDKQRVLFIGTDSSDNKSYLYSVKVDGTGLKKMAGGLSGIANLAIQP
jgi:hypothetical protein